MRQFILASLLLIAIAPMTSFAREHVKQFHPYYGGGHHTKSHGGRYSGGRGSSHKGGHYKNPRTLNKYGRHKL